MKIKVNGVTYNGIRKNSPAWYVLGTVKAIGYFLWLLMAIGFMLLVIFTMLALG